MLVISQKLYVGEHYIHIFQRAEHTTEMFIIEYHQVHEGILIQQLNIWNVSHTQNQVCLLELSIVCDESMHVWFGVWGVLNGTETLAH